MGITTRASLSMEGAVGVEFIPTLGMEGTRGIGLMEDMMGME